MTDKTTHTPLPCPFCGHRRRYNHADAPCGDRRYWTVICEGCEAHGPPFSECSGGEAEALTAWNTRTDSHHRLVEALEVMRGYGCPVCNGDCGSANPPVMSCPMLMIDAALKEAGRG